MRRRSKSTDRCRIPALNGAELPPNRYGNVGEVGFQTLGDGDGDGTRRDETREKEGALPAAAGKKLGCASPHPVQQGVLAERRRWESQAAKLKPSMSKRVSDLSTPNNIMLLMGYLAVVVIIAYIHSLSAEIKPFDPYQIMEVRHDASNADIKKAYRKLSLKYHPDKVSHPPRHHIAGERRRAGPAGQQWRE
jgi:hypothetical protein